MWSHFNGLPTSEGSFSPRDERGRDARRLLIINYGFWCHLGWLTSILLAIKVSFLDGIAYEEIKKPCHFVLVVLIDKVELNMKALKFSQPSFFSSLQLS